MRNSGKEDKRKYRSKRDLANALQELLEEKDFGEITIQELADKAMVSKLTFYNNFYDKNELLQFLFNKYSERVYGKIQDILAEDITAKEKYAKCVKEVIAGVRSLPFSLVNVIKSDTSRAVYWNLYKFIEESTLKLAALYGDILHLDVPGDILSYYYSGSFTSLIYNFAMKDEKDKPDDETIAQYIITLTNPKDL